MHLLKKVKHVHKLMPQASIEMSYKKDIIHIESGVPLITEESPVGYNLSVTDRENDHIVGLPLNRLPLIMSGIYVGCLVQFGLFGSYHCLSYISEFYEGTPNPHILKVFLILFCFTFLGILFVPRTLLRYGFEFKLKSRFWAIEDRGEQQNEQGEIEDEISKAEIYFFLGYLVSSTKHFHSNVDFLHLHSLTYTYCLKGYPMVGEFTNHVF